MHTDVLARLQPEQTGRAAGLDDALACQERDGAKANSTRLDLLEIVQSLYGSDLTARTQQYYQFSGTFWLLSYLADLHLLSTHICSFSCVFVLLNDFFFSFFFFPGATNNSVRTWKVAETCIERSSETGQTIVLSK